MKEKKSREYTAVHSEGDLVEAVYGIIYPELQRLLTKHGVSLTIDLKDAIRKHVKFDQPVIDEKEDKG
ncbi:hypothetical protein ACK8P5_16500 [Paenibacillus sp. EC2-1]|uniref:hypothetical protein n=1 Tax=Paenibacillus sp. EC2-1 TaxID=3388665 RepID=UPI003BEEB456